MSNTTIADAMNGGWALSVICLLIGGIAAYLIRRQNKHETLISLAATRAEMKDHFDQVKQNIQELKDISQIHAVKDEKFRHDHNDWQQGVSNQLAVLTERTKTQTQAIDKQAVKIDNLSDRVSEIDGENNRGR